MPMVARLLPAIVALIAAFNWVPASAATQHQRVLFNFVPPGGGTDDTKGYYPPLGVLVDTDDSVYGSTYYGGKNGGGTIYHAVGKTVTVLYSFTDQDTAGCGYNPSAVLIMKGKLLYGTTFAGGTGGGGVVYSLKEKSDSTKEWKCTPLFSFSNSGPGLAKGYGSFGGLALFDGDLYGTTQLGGKGDGGVLFKLTKAGSSWTYRVVQNFWTTGPNGSDGFTPAGRVISDGGTALYGMTFFGGIRSQGRNGGVIYKFTPSGGSGTYEVLFKFPGASSDGTASTAQGYQPTINGLKMSGGLLYGETTLGGDPNNAAVPAGVVFKFDPVSKTYSVLHTFDSSTDVANGYSPFGGLSFTATGALIGTAQFGGVQGGGVAFTVSKAGKFHKIFDFLTDTTTGYKPGGPLVMNSVGKFIGTTYYGGTANGGVLYSLTPP